MGRFQEEVLDAASTYWPDLIAEDRATVAKPNGNELELDGYSPTSHVAIEANGDLTHSNALVQYQEQRTAASKHQEKRQACERQGIKLAHVWQADWFERRPEVLAALARLHATGRLSPILTSHVGPRDHHYRHVDAHVYDHAINSIGEREVALQAIADEGCIDGVRGLSPRGRFTAWDVLEEVVAPNEAKGHRLHNINFRKFSTDHRIAVHELHDALLALTEAGVLVQVPSSWCHLGEGCTLLTRPDWLLPRSVRRTTSQPHYAKWPSDPATTVEIIGVLEGDSRLLEAYLLSRRPGKSR